MDTLTLDRQPSRAGNMRECVYVRINDHDLIELVRDAERAAASDDGPRQIHGGYDGVAPIVWVRISDMIAGDGGDHDNRVAILDCDCGVSSCWPLYVRVSADEDTVRLDEFGEPRGKGVRPLALGPYIFAREDVEDAINSLFV